MIKLILPMIGIALVATLLLFIHIFHAKRALYLPLVLVLMLFTIGFWLRLSVDKEVIDIGFFLTEISQLFVSIMFTAVLVLGQQKYWKV